MVVLLDGLPDQPSGGGDAAAALSTLGREGRRIGIHLLVASSAIRTLGELHLPGARVALRSAQPGESQALIGTAAADDAWLPRGRGFLRAPEGGVVEVHVPAAADGPLARVVDAVCGVAKLVGTPTDARGG
jgi:hypothetical protein